jgi:hypothetical protein
MKYPVHISKRVVAVYLTAAAIVVAAVLLEVGCGRGEATNADRPQESGTNSKPLQSDPAVELSPSQVNSIRIEPVGTYVFPVEKEAVGVGAAQLTSVNQAHEQVDCCAHAAHPSTAHRRLNEPNRAS